MARFSNTSTTKLVTCSKNLQLLFNRVVKTVDCTIVEGHRNRETQNRMFDRKRSQLCWPNSSHNIILSRAVDVVPYLHGIDWRSEADLLKAIANKESVGKIMVIVHNIERWLYFVGFVMGTAKEMGIKIRWGGDWDGDTELADNNFDDWPHFEEILEE